MIQVFSPDDIKQDEIQKGMLKTPKLQSLAAIFNKADKPIDLNIINVPELREGEMLIKNEYTTLCRSDINTYCGKRIEKTPTILGHEIIGRIAAFGPQANDMDIRGRYLKIGNRITWAIYATDPNDINYINGIPQKVNSLYKYGHEQINDQQTLNGGLSEYIILKPHTPIIKINEDVPITVAATINCTISTIAGAMRLLGDVAGKNILISGSGMLGMMAIAMCKTKQANKITVVDTLPERLSLAPYFGANHMILASEFNREKLKSLFNTDTPFDGVIEVSGTNTAMQNSIEALKTGGTSIWLGATFPQPDLCISAEMIVRKLIAIKGLHNYNINDFIHAVEFIENSYQHFPFESLIHDAFKLNQVNEAFQYALIHNPFRVGISLK